MVDIDFGTEKQALLCSGDRIYLDTSSKPTAPICSALAFYHRSSVCVPIPKVTIHILVRFCLATEVAGVLPSEQIFTNCVGKIRK